MKNEFTLKLISIFIGFSGAFFVLEIFARILPAANIIGLEKPIRCEDLNYINQDCLHRRRKKISFRYTKGKYPPFEIDAIKSTNDIGQFSNIDFFEFVSYESNLDKKRIITSTEALSLKEIPKHLIIIGGGVIGLELGQVYNRLGSKVSVIEYLSLIHI